MPLINEHGTLKFVLSVVENMYAERGITKFGRTLAKLCHLHGRWHVGVRRWHRLSYLPDPERIRHP